MMKKQYFSLVTMFSIYLFLGHNVLIAQPSEEELYHSLHEAFYKVKKRLVERYGAYDSKLRAWLETILVMPNPYTVKKDFDWITRLTFWYIASNTQYNTQGKETYEETWNSLVMVKNVIPLIDSLIDSQQGRNEYDLKKVLFENRRSDEEMLQSWYTSLTPKERFYLLQMLNILSKSSFVRALAYSITLKDLRVSITKVINDHLLFTITACTLVLLMPRLTLRAILIIAIIIITPIAGFHQIDDELTMFYDRLIDILIKKKSPLAQ